MIAVDAMGGDHAPYEIVRGSLWAAKRGIPVILFGNKQSLALILTQLFPEWHQLPIELEHCTDVIAMNDEPTRSILKKKNSSLVRALHAVASGKAGSLVSAGNSGAVVVGSTLILERVKGVYRPAIGSFIPTKNSSVFCLDLGANAECKSSFLEQFSLMGHLIVKQLKNIKNPRIALLSNGHESSKGTNMYKEVYDSLQKMDDIHFVGNLEPHEIFDDKADAIICDGFTGNVFLKSIQGTVRVMFHWLKDDAKQSIIRRFLLWLNKNVFMRLQKKTSYTSVGGALLLGVNHPVILAHGRSNAYAVENAISYAYQVIKNNTISVFNKQLLIKLQQKEMSNSDKGNVLISQNQNQSIMP